MKEKYVVTLKKVVSVSRLPLDLFYSPVISLVIPPSRPQELTLKSGNRVITLSYFSDSGRLEALVFDKKAKTEARVAVHNPFDEDQPTFSQWKTLSAKQKPYFETISTESGTKTILWFGPEPGCWPWCSSLEAPDNISRRLISDPSTPTSRTPTPDTPPSIDSRATTKGSGSPSTSNGTSPSSSKYESVVVVPGMVVKGDTPPHSPVDNSPVELRSFTLTDGKEDGDVQYNATKWAAQLASLVGRDDEGTMEALQGLSRIPASRVENPLAVFGDLMPVLKSHGYVGLRNNPLKVEIARQIGAFALRVFASKTTVPTLMKSDWTSTIQGMLDTIGPYANPSLRCELEIADASIRLLPATSKEISQELAEVIGCFVDIAVAAAQMKPDLKAIGTLLSKGITALVDRHDRAWLENVVGIRGLQLAARHNVIPLSRLTSFVVSDPRGDHHMHQATIDALTDVICTTTSGEVLHRAWNGDGKAEFTGLIYYPTFDKFRAMNNWLVRHDALKANLAIVSHFNRVALTRDLSSTEEQVVASAQYAITDRQLNETNSYARAPLTAQQESKAFQGLLTQTFTRRKSDLEASVIATAKQTQSQIAALSRDLAAQVRLGNQGGAEEVQAQLVIQQRQLTTLMANAHQFEELSGKTLEATGKVETAVKELSAQMSEVQESILALREQVAKAASELKEQSSKQHVVVVDSLAKLHSSMVTLTASVAAPDYPRMTFKSSEVTRAIDDAHSKQWQKVYSLRKQCNFNYTKDQHVPRNMETFPGQMAEFLTEIDNYVNVLINIRVNGQLIYYELPERHEPPLSQCRYAVFQFARDQFLEAIASSPSLTSQMAAIQHKVNHYLS